MPNLSIKNVPEHVVKKLRQRAVQNHRSLQGELLELICRITEDDLPDNNSIAKEGELSGWLSIEEIAADIKSSRRRGGAKAPLAVDIVRQDRDSR